MLLAQLRNAGLEGVHIWYVQFDPRVSSASRREQRLKIALILLYGLAYSVCLPGV